MLRIDRPPRLQRWAWHQVEERRPGTGGGTSGDDRSVGFWDVLMQSEAEQTAAESKQEVEKELLCSLNINLFFLLYLFL